MATGAPDNAPSQPDDAAALRTAQAATERLVGQYRLPPAPKREGAIIADSDNMHEDSLRVQHLCRVWLGTSEIKRLLDVGLALLGPWVELIDGYREATDRARVGMVWHHLLFRSPDLSKRAGWRATLDGIVNPHLAFLDDWYERRVRRNYAAELPGGDGTLDEQGKEERFKERMSRLAQTIDKSETRVVDTSPFHNAYTNLVCDRDKPAVEPPKLQRSWTCMTAFWEYALTSRMRPWAVQEFEKASYMLTEAVFLGGVGVKSARTALKKQLDAYSYAKDSDRHAVWLFCNRHEEWDGTVFDASLPKTTKDMAAFEGTNIHPVRLCDPTREAPWGEEELGTFYAVVDAVIRAVVSDKRVFVACYAGKNRSVAVKHALAPWAYPRTKPGCDSMLRAAEGYRNNRDMSLVPLAPKMGKRKHGDGSGASA